MIHFELPSCISAQCNVDAQPNPVPSGQPKEAEPMDVDDAAASGGTFDAERNEISSQRRALAQEWDKLNADRQSLTEEQSRQSREAEQQRSILEEETERLRLQMQSLEEQKASLDQMQHQQGSEQRQSAEH